MHHCDLLKRVRHSLAYLCLIVLFATQLSILGTGQAFAAEASKAAETDPLVDESGVTRHHPKKEYWLTANDLSEILPLLIPITAIVFGIGLTAFIIGVEYRRKQQLLTVCHQERMAALEKGLELPPFPPEFQRDPSVAPVRRRGTGLLPGLICLGVGIGMYICFGNRVGAIPGGIGVAFLLYYAIEGRKHRPKLDSQKVD
ncbi:MAG TPA: DUF6249 domain-containing protein [Candidatus Limnocylindria bacterium]|jgi:multisubunit Na+/H+ antiporter MnhC subunit|nr:DUF6249 domain-containing protein [Candidatus Limnocylindria bacterium]